MFDNFITCFNAIVPLAVYLIIGMFIRRAKLLSEEDVHKVNKVLFKAFYPFMMFDSLYTADVRTAFSVRLVAFALCFLLVFITLAAAVIARIEPSDRSRGAMIQAVYRSNYILMGIPVATNIFGKGNVAAAAVLAMFIVPAYNILAVVILERFRGGKANPKKLVYEVVTNPIIVGAVFGIIALVCNIQLPHSLERVTAGMNDATAPMALAMLGASFNLKSINAERRNIVIAVVGKLIVQPAVGLPIAIAMGFRGIELVALTIMMASPCAVSSYAMADAMDSDGELAGNAIIITTPLACLTLFLWLFVFKTVGLF